MKLIQYNNFDVATSTINEGFETKDPYLVIDDGDVVPADYTDVSQDIQAINRFLSVKKIDYLAASLLIKQAVTALGFNSFDSDDKMLICKHNAADTATEIVPFYEAALGITAQQAQDYHGLKRLENLRNNRDACEERYQDIDSPSGWYAIILTFFSEYDAFAIKAAAMEKYIPNYREDALLGGNYDIGLLGILDFINNTNAVGTSIENFPLKGGGSDYTVVQALLTKKFAI